MQQNSDITNVTDFDASNSRRYLFGSQACWATTSEVQSTVLQKSDGYSSQEQQSVIASIKPPPMDVEYPTPPQAELTGHSIACASYPYSDPYHGGAVPAYSPQASVHYNAVGASHARMALSSLPHEVMEEPVYVNPKQYHGILRRRQSRAKAEAKKRLIKSRKPYLHESRHLHAMRRARGSGGRFLNTKKLQHRASNLTSNTSTNYGPSSTVNYQSCSYSLAPKSDLPSSFTNAGSSISHKEEKEPIQNMQSFQQFYPSQRGSENSMFYSFLNGRVEGGEGSRQQKLNAGVSMNRTPKNAVRIR